jgi:predicted DsbA family dithiol-disulfide isomerase
MTSLANELTVESPLISTAAIDATEFPDLVRRYNVNGVPKTIINDCVEILGAASEEELVTAITETSTP